jgi:hypothetical protein
MLRSKRERLRVTPKWSLASGWTGLLVDVANLSSFPVTIIEIGFTLDRSRRSLPKRVPIPAHAIVHGDCLPATVQPLHSISIVFGADWLHELRVCKAYALTSGGGIARRDKRCAEAIPIKRQSLARMNRYGKFS